MPTRPTTHPARRWRRRFDALALLALVLIAASGPAAAQFSFGFGGFGGGFGGGRGGGYGGGRMPPAQMARPRYPGPAAQRPSRYPGPAAQRPPRSPGAVAQRPPGYPGRVAQRPPRYPTPYPPRGQAQRPPYPAWPRPVWNRPPRAPVYVAPVPPAFPPPPALAAQPPGLPPGGGAPARPLPPAPTPPASAPAPETVAGEVLFRTAGPASVDAVDRAARGYGLSRIGYRAIPLTGQTIYQYRVANGRPVDAVVRRLQADARFASVQPNFVFRLQQQRNEARLLAPSQYAVGKLHLAEAHALATGEGVLVAVIDSGVDGTHPELAGALSASLNALATEGKPDPHGTGIAAAIAARGQLLGVAPATRILAIRAFDLAAGRTGATGTTFDLLNAVSIAAGAGARVVNMSFAGPRDPLLGEALAVGRARGIVFVAAAGNNGPSAPPAYPAAEPGVIAVTATDVADRRFPAANVGPYVGVAAPGVDILVAAPGGAYGFSSGTSVAAAHVSGIVALLLQRNAALSPDDVRGALTGGATDLGTAGTDPEFGAGLVDPLRSLQGLATGATAAAATH